MILNLCIFSIILIPVFRTIPNLKLRMNLNEGYKILHKTDYFNGGGHTTVKYITDLDKIYKNNGIISFILAITFCSFAGIPPLAGFYSKYLILNSMAQWEYYIILNIALITTIISAFYYINVIKHMFFNIKMYSNVIQYTLKYIPCVETNFNIYICI